MESHFANDEGCVPS